MTSLASTESSGGSADGSRRANSAAAGAPSVAPEAASESAAERKVRKRETLREAAANAEKERSTKTLVASAWAGLEPDARLVNSLGGSLIGGGYRTRKRRM